MQKSRFNLFVPENNESQLVYNTLKGSITRVSNSLAEIISKGDINHIRSSDCTSLFNDLFNQGVIVPYQYDEIGEYERMHKRWKEGKENVEFNTLLTYDCNFECPYCYQGRGEKGKKIHGFKYMDNDLLEAVKKFIKKTTADRRAKKLELVLYGGEPFMEGAKNLGIRLTDEIAEWSRENKIDFRLHVLSNGSLINQNIINWLAGYNTRIQIPIDGDPEMHNQYRFYKETKKGSFDDITKVLSMTKSAGIETHIRISLTDETYPTMDNLLNELKSRGLNHVYPDFCYITSFTEACANFEQHILPDLRLFEVMPSLWLKAHEKGFPLDIRPKVQPLPCSSIADGSFIIDPFGKVYKCWELVGLDEHKVGLIDNEGHLKKTAVYEDVLQRNPLNITACKNHSYLPACGGGCCCKAQWRFKTYHAPGCGSEKYLLKDKIKIYTKTLDLSKISKNQTNGSLWLQKIEGRQEPSMSHCYVLV